MMLKHKLQNAGDWICKVIRSCQKIYDRLLWCFLRRCLPYWHLPMATLDSFLYRRNISLYFKRSSLLFTVRTLWEELGKKVKEMARKIVSTYKRKSKVRRPNVHSKNASVGQKGYKKKYRGQGR